MLFKKQLITRLKHYIREAMSYHIILPHKSYNDVIDFIVNKYNITNAIETKQHDNKLLFGHICVVIHNSTYNDNIDNIKIINLANSINKCINYVFSNVLREDTIN